jgi:hypothetical protein
MRNRLAQREVEFVVLHAQHACQRGVADVPPAGDRSGAHHPLSGGPELLDPREEDVGESSRYTTRVSRCGGEQFLGKERVAFGAFGDSVDGIVVESLVSQRPDEGPRIVQVERMEIEAFDNG